jgi:3-isopropylmalate dehydrogenase
MRVIRSAHGQGPDRGGHSRPKRWTDCLGLEKLATPRAADEPIVIGVLAGDGGAAEAIACALAVLESVAEATSLGVQVVESRPKSAAADETPGMGPSRLALPGELARFCADVFARGGAILNGAIGGRCLDELRRQLDLFLNLCPVRMVNGLPDASPLRPQMLHATDLLLTCDNTAAVCRDSSAQRRRTSANRMAEHTLAYAEDRVRRFLLAATKLARARSGKLMVVCQEAALPAASALWRDCAAEAARSVGVRIGMIDAGLMAYRLIREAQSFDVIAAPSLPGALLGDVSGALLGTRGLLCSADFGASGAAVYQANHQACGELAGKDRGNPGGAILALAMLLRESFDLCGHAELIEEALRLVWREGWRTADVATPSARVVGTSELGRRVAETAGRLARRRFRPNRDGHQVA